MPSSCPPDSGTSVQPYFQLVMSFLFPHHQVLKLVWGPSIGRKEVSWLQKTFRVASLHKREQQALGEERKSPSWGWRTRKGGCHAPESGWDTVTSFITHDPPNHVCLPVDRFAFRMKSAWLPLSCHSKHISPIVSSSIKERRDIKMSILWCWCKEEGKFWVWSPGIPPGAGKDSVHTSQITHSCASRRLLRSILGEFSDGPKARTWHLHCRGLSSVPCQGTKIPQVSRHSQEQKTPKQKKKSIFSGTSERSQTCWYGHHQNKREKSKQKGGKEVWITLYHEKFLTLDGPFYVNHTQVFFIRKAKPVSVWGQKRLRFTSYSAQRFELSAESQ